MRASSWAARPISSRASARVTSSSSAAASVSTSPSSTGIFSAAASGSSENQPTSLTTSGLPSESARIAIPDVSPIVG